jgi:hypothetical protein
MREMNGNKLIGQNKGAVVVLWEVIFALCLAGCEQPAPEMNSESNVENISAKKVSERDRENLSEGGICIERSEVIYHTRLNPEKLTDDKLQKLSEYIGRTQLKEKEVWFVRVVYNSSDSFRAAVYFKPERTRERTRWGKYIWYDSFLDDIELPDEFLERAGLSREEVIARHCKNYIQVSTKGDPFTEGKQEIPPQNLMLPFEMPEDFSEQEIVEIIDFIRSKPRIKTEGDSRFLQEIIAELYKAEEFDKSDLGADYDLPEQTTTWYPDVAGEQPVMSMNREGEDIVIETGTVEGMLAGSGAIIKIRKTEDGYELLEVGMWVS